MVKGPRGWVSLPEPGAARSAKPVLVRDEAGHRDRECEHPMLSGDVIQPELERTEGVADGIRRRHHPPCLDEAQADERVA